MGKSTLHIATRRPNGQVGYISDALEIPEFVDMIRAIGGRSQVLVDYSPVIKALHTLYSQSNDKATRDQFNSLYNFWQESNSYKNPSNRVVMAMRLVEVCNEFICSMHTRLQTKETEFRTKHDDSERLKCAQSIKQDADMYIVALLCLIHSKAALEIQSFQEETVISSYGDFLFKLVDELYRWQVRSNDASNSFLRCLAVEYQAKLPDHLALLAPTESVGDFLLRTLSENKPFVEYGQEPRQAYSWMAAKITYDFHSWESINTADILKDLRYRAQSVCAFIAGLKQPDVSWDDSAAAILALTAEVRFTATRQSKTYRLG